MKPHCLKFSALGPYPGEVEIHFDDLVAEGLFLIHGPTGAGKTFLLDAICFALYGDVPGERRPDTIRSHHAPADASPEVELEFTSQTARWRVRRVPKHTRASARGEGTTTIQASATLEKREGESWRAVAQRVREVNQEIDGLLGLNAEQFQRVMLLPQGRFEKVLRSKSAEREKLMRTLFETAITIYESASKWLDQQAKERIEKVDELERYLTSLRSRAAERWRAVQPDEQDESSAADSGEASGIDESWPGDQAALDALLEETAHSAERAGQAAASAEKELDSARSTKADEDRLAERWDTRKRLLKRRAELAEAQSGIDDNREIVRLAEEAEGLRQTLKDEQHRRARLKDCANQVSKRFAVTQERVANAPSLPEALRLPPMDDEAFGERLASIDTALVRHRAKLESFVGDAKAATERESAAAKERETAATKRRLSQEQTDAAAEHENNRQSAQTELDAARSAAERIPILETAAKQANERAEAATELGSLGPRLDDAERALRRAQQATLDRRTELLDLRQRYLDGIAAVLAGQLDDATACPVCGSTDHPNPATPAPDAVGIEEVKSAEAEVEKASEAEEAAREAHQEIARTVAELRGRAGDAADDPVAATEHAERLRLELQTAVDRAGQVDELQRTVENHQKAAGAATEAAQKYMQEATAAAERAELAEGEAAKLRAGIERAIGAIDPSDAINGIDSVRDALEELGAAERARAAAQTGLEALKETLAEQIAATQFAEPDAARSALRDSAELADLRRRVKKYDEEVRDVGRDLGADELQDLPEERPDTDAADQAVIAADAAAGRAREARTRTVDAYRAIDGWTADHRRRGAAYDRALEEANLWSVVADRCNGRTPPRVSLQRWVLSAYLEEICGFANQRLHAMTSGRYRLSVHRDREWGGAQSGLGLRVHDAWTGEEREVSTLSGGETFQASLCLALAVADGVAAHSGGVRLETLFIDEGFGTLDSEALQQAMDELDRLREGGRTVGLISHVTELRERIRTGIEVLPTPQGSTIKVGTISPC